MTHALAAMIVGRALAERTGRPRSGLDHRARPRPTAPWGMLAAIDVHECDRSRLRDSETIRRFVPAMIDAIGMRAHGPLVLDRFGGGELEGWSAMQFIETSSITVHADEAFGRCFVDVFSCRPFDPDAAVPVAVGHFGGIARVRVLSR
jgi:S-adenosylmethionine/arginine decarboxylase-like enzyme